MCRGSDAELYLPLSTKAIQSRDRDIKKRKSQKDYEARNRQMVGKEHEKVGKQTRINIKDKDKNKQENKGRKWKKGKQ